MYQKKPLYRKVNTRTRGVLHGNGGKSKWERNTKAEKSNQSSRGSMHSNHRHGLDYTPLFKFLLTKVGQNWDDVHSEAVERLDHSDPIFWMVARHEKDKCAFVRVGESKYFSGLFIDDSNCLAIVDPDLCVDDMKPTCPCCTHTFNGERFTQHFSDN